MAISSYPWRVNEHHSIRGEYLVQVSRAWCHEDRDGPGWRVFVVRQPDMEWVHVRHGFATAEEAMRAADAWLDAHLAAPLPATTVYAGALPTERL